jgi:hypothetical protein
MWSAKVTDNATCIEAFGEWYSGDHGYLSLNEVTKVDDIFYFRLEFLQSELILRYLMSLKNGIRQPQSLQCGFMCSFISFWSKIPPFL